ncbi:hypothetical protein E4O00_09185 [Treponema sp. OMZ 788]|uniref:hypothetical protein n=1 Tax=Treponema sp. OMZ 788 TaxID=2563664 RepID=UPI0020A32503|nr:hypothetical protein [Treponema sp. OMZ 788]UTC64038.1 hypothetical protein E4O00_09185 [Treponema sp. OMZ 788]
MYTEVHLWARLRGCEAARLRGCEAANFAESGFFCQVLFITFFVNPTSFSVSSIQHGNSIQDWRQNCKG